MNTSYTVEDIKKYRKKIEEEIEELEFNHIEDRYSPDERFDTEENEKRYYECCEILEFIDAKLLK